VLAGQVGVGGHITIGRGAKAGGGAAITTDISPGSYVNGYPAIPYLLERRIAVLRQRLPQLFHRVDALEAQIKELGGG
jgi:UDP-3-O-[3-hydroxymyristoyl] glucosamine N-acyltransferase